MAFKSINASSAYKTDDIFLSDATDIEKLLNTALELGISIPIYLMSPPNLLVWILWPASSIALAGFFTAIATKIFHDTYHGNARLFIV